ncbi:MAG: hypothetical protein QOJ18_1367 [Microbacteriaceae bacterium]|jgi:hypothetical protein|nr:hypothetical protein [Microbacteriaceae bacterium]
MPPALDQAGKHVVDKTPRLPRLRPGSSTTGGLPGGWLLRHHVRSNGRSVFEILDAHHDTVGLTANTGHPRNSVDAAWRGHWNDPGVGRRWWALAMGHVDGDARPSVTFVGRLPNGCARRTSITPIVVDGLWIAVVFGRHGAVTLRQGAFHHVMRISPTWRSRA